jgi:hypothetical protein
MYPSTSRWTSLGDLERHDVIQEGQRILEVHIVALTASFGVHIHWYAVRLVR